MSSLFPLLLCHQPPGAPFLCYSPLSSAPLGIFCRQKARMKVSQTYSPSQISLHTTKKDCWLIIHGKVYDVTTFLEEHPGGDEVLLDASANGDSTQKFEEVGHSSTAFSMMESYLIGVVEGYEGSAGEGGAKKIKDEVGGVPAMAAKTLKERKPPSSSGFLDLLLPVLILGLAFGAWYYLTTKA